MDNNQNRVINDLQKWQEMETKWKNLFGPQIVNQRYFVKERLKELQDIPKKYAGQGRSMTSTEKSALKIVKGEIDRMEKVVYPNAVVRSLVKLFDAVKDLAMQVKKQPKEEVVWKPSIGPIKVNEIASKDKTQEVSLSKSQSYQSKKDKGPNRDLRNNSRIDDDPLLVKLKTGQGKGIRQ